MRSHQSNPGDQQGFAGFPTNLQTLSLGFVQNVQELQVNRSKSLYYIVVFIRRISLRIFHYLHIFGIPGIPQYHVCLESRLFHDAAA